MLDSRTEWGRVEGVHRGRLVGCGWGLVEVGGKGVAISCGEKTTGTVVAGMVGLNCFLVKQDKN